MKGGIHVVSHCLSLGIFIVIFFMAEQWNMWTWFSCFLRKWHIKDVSGAWKYQIILTTNLQVFNSIEFLFKTLKELLCSFHKSFLISKDVGQTFPAFWIAVNLPLALCSSNKTLQPCLELCIFPLLLQSLRRYVYRKSCLYAAVRIPD